ncbi:MAG: hypothetical protein ACFFCM_22960 [Promethearchaeota archaeon]
MTTESKISMPERLTKNWAIKLGILEKYFDIIKDRIQENKIANNYSSLNEKPQIINGKVLKGFN